MYTDTRKIEVQGSKNILFTQKVTTPFEIAKVIDHTFKMQCKQADECNVNWAVQRNNKKEVSFDAKYEDGEYDVTLTTPSKKKINIVVTEKQSMVDSQEKIERGVKLAWNKHNQVRITINGSCW